MTTAPREDGQPVPVPPVTVLIADDHPVVRTGLRAVLETEPDLIVQAEAATGQQAIDRCAADPPDVVLMDLQFGSEPDGIEATRRITGRASPPRVLVLTTYDADADILAAVEAGATGYLLKDVPPEDLAASIRQAAAGRSALAPEVADRLLGQLRSPATVTLTDREQEVLALVAQGHSNDEVGRRLFLSRATVKTHLVHIYGKLGVGTRTAAVSAAREQGILR